MRVFIAVSIPERSKKLLENKVNKIKASVNQDLKWVESKNWHLTLKFLGETDKRKINEIKKKISETVNNYNSFPLKFRGINAFPNMRYPKVLFIDIKWGKDNLIKMKSELDKSLSEIGFSLEDRDFKPHLTIARSRNNTDLKKLAESLAEFDSKNFINIYMETKEIKLMKSELYPSGPAYEELFTKILK